MDADELNQAVALEVFGVDAAVLASWRWPAPAFATDRNWSAAVMTEMWSRPDAVRLAFERALADQAAQLKVKGGLVEAMIVNTPDKICIAALTAIRCASPEPI